MQFLSSFSTILTLLAILGCGMMAGLFFAFSACVMSALSGRPTHEGIAAMQSMNVTILNPFFFVLFLSTPIFCMLVAWSSLARGFDAIALFQIAGASSYLGGCLLVTIACNIPRNNRLAQLDPTAVVSEQHWHGFVSSWSAWNHVRTISAIIATVCFTITLIS